MLANCVPWYRPESESLDHEREGRVDAVDLGSREAHSGEVPVDLLIGHGELELPDQSGQDDLCSDA